MGPTEELELPGKNRQNPLLLDHKSFLHCHRPQAFPVPIECRGLLLNWDWLMMHHRRLLLKSWLRDRLMHDPPRPAVHPHRRLQTGRHRLLNSSCGKLLVGKLLVQRLDPGGRTRSRPRRGGTCRGNPGGRTRRGRLCSGLRRLLVGMSEGAQVLVRPGRSHTDSGRVARAWAWWLMVTPPAGGLMVLLVLVLHGFTGVAMLDHTQGSHRRSYAEPQPH